MEERIAEFRKRRADVKKTDAYIPDDCELLQDGINAVFNEETNLLIDDSVWKKPKKTWNKRPDNWQFTANESAIYGTASVIRSFKEVFKGLTSSAAKQGVITWRKDLKTPERISDYRVRMLVYGADITEWK